MSIPTSGSAALMVVVMLALASCGSDDAATEAQADGAAAVETVTQTATATAPQDEAGKTTSTPPAAAKTETRTQTEAQTEAQADPPTAKSPATPEKRGVCANVEVGARDGDVEVTYARITQARNVDCVLATEIAVQWGRQQMGIDKALLPLDWDCTKGNVCANGSRRVTFELLRP